MKTTAYWNYFLSLERDFIRTIDFVELAPSNSGAFGDNYAKLLLAAGSEVDVVCKALCKTLAPDSDETNINRYRARISASYPRIHEARVLVDRTGLEVVPWDTWDPAVSQSPQWWKAYNDVKHNRVLNFTSATQENTLSALCGLLIVNMYYHFASGAGPQFPDAALLNAGRLVLWCEDSSSWVPPGMTWGSV